MHDRMREPAGRYLCAGAMTCAMVLGCARGPVWAGEESEVLAPDVEVRSQRIESTYVPGNVRSATRTDTPMAHIPQSVSVVSRGLLADQAAQSYADALRNVASVQTVDPRDSNNSNLRVRGFPAALVVDGIASPGSFAIPETLVNVERIEIVKGPGGALYGGAQAAGGSGFLGGVVAVTTKAPEAAVRREVGVRVGSYAQRALFFDLNQPVTQETGVRLAGELYRTRSETDRLSSEHVSLFPSFAWRPDADSQLTLRLRYSDASTLDYSGLPTRGTVVDAPYSVPRSRVITAEGVPDTTTETRSASMEWSTRIDERFAWGVVAGYTKTTVDQRGVFPTFFGHASAEAGPVLTVSGARLWDEITSIALSPSFTATLKGESVTHIVSVGADFDRTRDNGFLRLSPDPFFSFGVLGSVDVTDPIYPVWAEPEAPATPDQQNRFRSAAFYLQDQLTWGRLHLLGALRYTRIKVDDVNTLYGYDNHTRNSALTPRVGATYEVAAGISAFAGYGEGMRIPTFAVFSEPPEPEESRQYEVGLRLSNRRGVTATLAWFDLRLRNTTLADPAHPGFSIQAGESRSQGWDLDMVWQIDRHWALLGSYVSQDPRIVQDPTLAGKQLFNVARRAGRLATRYDIREGGLVGMGVGLGLTHHSSLPGDNRNSFVTPAITVWDAQVTYEWRKVQLTLGINNLTDKQYFEPSRYFGGGQVLPAARRTISLTGVLNF